MPRVSVVIPAHNAALFLPDALRSVESQSFQDWEIVGVDDGSTDETLRILSEAGPRVHVLRNDRPCGPARARNQALSNASGELAVFLDADDMLLPRYLERQIAFFETVCAKGESVGLITCDAHLLDGDHLTAHTYMDMIPDRCNPITLDSLLIQNSIYIASLVPVSVGESVGWFNADFLVSEDYDLWLRILERGYSAWRNPEPLGVYRRHRGTLTTDIARLGTYNRKAYEAAITRGALSRRQTRIARRSVRYSVALETIAAMRFASNAARPTKRDLIRRAPLLLWVVATNRQLWNRWLAVLRTGRVPPTSARS